MSVPLGYPRIIVFAWLYEKSLSASRVTTDVGSLEALMILVVTSPNKPRDLLVDWWLTLSLLLS